MIPEKEQLSFWKRHFRKIIFGIGVFLVLLLVGYGIFYYRGWYISQLYKYYFEDKTGFRVVSHQPVSNWNELFIKDAGKHACFSQEVRLRTGKSFNSYSGYSPDELAEGGCLLVNNQMIKSDRKLYCSEASFLRFFANPCLSDHDLQTYLVEPCNDNDFRTQASLLKSAIISGRKELFTQLVVKFPKIPLGSPAFLLDGYIFLLSNSDFGTRGDLETLDAVISFYAENRRAARHIEALFFNQKAAENLAGLRIIAAKVGKLKHFRKKYVLKMIKEESDELGEKVAGELTAIVQSITVDS